MSQTPFVSTDTQRTSIRESIADALKVRGFLVSPGTSGKLLVASNDPAIGHLGILTFWSVYTSPRGPYGYVELDPATALSGAGRYRVNAAGAINIAGLVRRLREVAPKKLAQREASKAAAERDAADKAIRQSLTIPEVPEGESIDVSVWKGLVDIRLTNLTPAIAQAVLAVLKGGV